MESRPPPGGFDGQRICDESATVIFRSASIATEANSVLHKIAMAEIAASTAVSLSNHLPRRTSVQKAARKMQDRTTENGRKSLADSCTRLNRYQGRDRNGAPILFPLRGYFV